MTEDSDVRVGDIPDYPSDAAAMRAEKYEYDAELDLAYDYELEVIDKGIREQAETRARTYLSQNGDAVWARVKGATDDAEALLQVHPGASLVLFVSAAELVVRFLLLRPLLAGLIFDDSLDERLSVEASTGQAGRDRKLLPHVLRAWEIETTELSVPDAGPLWSTYEDCCEKRNSLVHKGSPVSDGAALVAIACLEVLIRDVLGSVVIRLGMKWPETDWLMPPDEPKDPFAPRS